MADKLEDHSSRWKASSLVFSSRYKKLQLNNEIPTYSVGYLGKCNIEDCSEISEQDYRTELVAKICRSIREEKRKPKRVEVSISWHGVEIVDAKTGHEELVPIYLVNRGMTDMEKPRIFAFISQNVESKLMECQAFVSTKPETSWAMTLCLKRSFEVAYDAWKIEQKKTEKFYNDRLLDLAEDLLKARHDDDDHNDTKHTGVNGNSSNTPISVYNPRTTWTKFEEDLMEKSSSSRFSFKKNKLSSFRRMPSVREVVGQPAVDTMFRQRQKLTSYASVFDVGDNEGLRKVAQDEDVMILSVTGMDKKQKDKDQIDMITLD
eukprot:gene15924-17525_t